VLLPAPDERPALTIYQEAGQFLGVCISGWFKTVFGQKRLGDDSKTGRGVCLVIMQNRVFAH
jgi:hypothetical protein